MRHSTRAQVLVSVTLVAHCLVLGMLATAAAISDRDEPALLLSGPASVALCLLAFAAKRSWRRQCLLAIAGAACAASSFMMFSFERWPGWIVTSLVILSLLLSVEDLRSDSD